MNYGSVALYREYEEKERERERRLEEMYDKHTDCRCLVEKAPQDTYQAVLRSGRGGLVDQLCQKENWITGDGQVFALTELKNSHLLNIILFIERRSTSLKTQFDFRLADAGLDKLGATMNTALKEIWNQSAEEWLKGTPLYLSLIQQVEERQLAELLEIARRR